MVATVEQIRKDLAAIEAATTAMADDFKTLYKSYLKALSRAARQQLILASYHLCTQAYPQAFLRLSVSQRQTLQKDLRALGNDMQHRLITLSDAGEGWQQSLLIPDADSLALDAEAGEEATDLAESSGDAEETASGDAVNQESESTADTAVGGTTAEADQEAEEALPEMPLVKAMLMNAMLEAMDPTMAEAEASGEPMTPSRLAKRHFFLEQRIRMTLHRVSTLANRLFQKMDLLPDLPEAVLAAATDADMPMEKSASAPNVLSVLVEMARDAQGLAKDPRNTDADDDSDLNESEANEEEDDDDDIDSEDSEEESRETTHLVAINLRLSDIEFTDTQSALWRSRLREALGKLKQLGGKYQKKQQELAIAEAELAWRSIWYDDAPRDEPSERG